MQHSMTPREVVRALDQYIVGQDAAKRAVAVALRSRYRRRQLPLEMQEDIIPKNILMIGPTGVGKTEIARRLAKLVQAPFVKVEASKFTEVGYVGRDVESIVRDLVEASIRMVRDERLRKVASSAKTMAEEKIAEALASTKKKSQDNNPFAQLFGGQKQEEEPETEEVKLKRSQIKDLLAQGKLEDTQITIEVDEVSRPMEIMPGSGMEINIGDMFGGMMPTKKKQLTLTVREARPILQQEAAEHLIDKEDVNTEALHRASQDGIVFIDEIDKIASRSQHGSGPDVSREGVQRDILPIVEGCTVSTKYGPVKTDHILFVGAGAFHIARVEDLIPELQGRFPVRVELTSLTVEDFVRILTQTQCALLTQYQHLLAVDNVKLTFTPEGVMAIAQWAFDANAESENLGARRLHGVVEMLLEELSYNAGGDHPEVVVEVDAEYVHKHLKGERRNLERYIL